MPLTAERRPLVTVDTFVPPRPSRFIASRELGLFVVLQGRLQLKWLFWRERVGAHRPVREVGSRFAFDYGTRGPGPVPISACAALNAPNT